VNIISRYMFRNLLGTLALTIIVLSVVLVVGTFAKLSGFLAHGVPVKPLLYMVVLKLPQILGYTVPFGLLLSTILVYNRMSADYEITAMRASGISLLQVSMPAILLSIVLSALCGWLQLIVAPSFSHEARWLVREQGVKNPLAMLDEGRFVELFDGMIISIDRRDGDRVEEVRIFRLDDHGRLSADIYAKEGRLIVDEATKTLNITLSKASITTVDPDKPADRTSMHMSEYTFAIDYGKRFNRKPLTRRAGDMDLRQLLAYIVLYTESGSSPTRLFVELHKRAAMSLAPFSFILLAIPLGLLIGRRERSSSILIGVGVMLAYYSLLTLFETFDDQAQISSHVLMWVPNLVCQAVGLVLLWRKR